MFRLRIRTLQPITCISSPVFVALHFCRTGPNSFFFCLRFSVFFRFFFILLLRVVEPRASSSSSAALEVAVGVPFPDGVDASFGLQASL